MAWRTPKPRAYTRFRRVSSAASARPCAMESPRAPGPVAQSGSAGPHAGGRAAPRVAARAAVRGARLGDRQLAHHRGMLEDELPLLAEALRDVGEDLLQPAARHRVVRREVGAAK